MKRSEAMLTDAWHVARVIGGDESEGQSSITNRLDLPYYTLEVRRIRLSRISKEKPELYIYIYVLIIYYWIDGERERR